MQKENQDVEGVNISFYENSYSARYILKSLLKQFVSYDQLSKTRRNLRLLKKIPQYSHSLSVLDYGFGHGTLLLRMPRRHRIFGCELSQEAVKNVKGLCSLLHREVTLYSPAEFISASPKQLFDLVICSHVLEHVNDEKALLEQFCNVISNQGYLLINVPINEVWKDPKHVREYSAERAREILKESGFAVEESIEADRWTAWILNHEYVEKTIFSKLFRVPRLIFALLPISILNSLEIFLPKKYKNQQLIVMARKL